jgi:hypothetical protein
MQVQDILGCQILLENVSSYVTYHVSQLTEWKFIAAVTDASDCLILLDINNIHVSAFNHGFDTREYLDGITPARVCQFHLAGHQHHGTHLIDTHDAPIIDAVWVLYTDAVRRFGNVSILIERDDYIPPISLLIKELDHAQRFGIYADAYLLRLLEAVKTDYPALHTLAVDELLERIGRDYIDACPSTHFSIRYFGRHLSAFIDETPSYREIPVLAEMARLEWLLTLAFDAADSSTLDEATLSALPMESWPGMHLGFTTHCKGMTFSGMHPRSGD